MSDEGLIEVLRVTEAAVRAAQARQLAAIAEVRARAGGWILAGGDRFVGTVEVAAAEIGPVLRLSRHAAAERVALADTLVSRLPRTLAALHRGELDLTRTRVIVAATDVLSADTAAVVEARVLPRAGAQTAPALRESCARAVIAADPAAAQRRHEQAVTDRAARLYPAEDGMATLWARMAAADAIRAFDALRRAADNASTPGDTRSAEARRVDTLQDLLLAADPDPADPAEPATSAGPPRRTRPGRPTPAAVHVTAAWTTLAGLDDEPCQLRGHLPITAQAARLIAGDAIWRRILTDPASGTVLDVGRTTYTPPAALAEHVRTRDRHCRFPGCRQPAGLDLDHTVEYPRGPTADHNLNAICRGHHLIKTHTRWRVRQRRDATLLWTSPAGQQHPTAPEPADHNPPDV